MNKLVLMLSVALAVLLVASVASATPGIEISKNLNNSNGNSGSIWTTNGDCGSAQQDENHYAIGDTVYINGDGFDPASYDWAITGQPGQASCDPHIVVMNGTEVVDETGAFCFAAYTVLAGDCGEYTVDFGKKNDNYRVDNPPVIPEFGFALGMTTILGALIAFFIIRKK